MGTNDEIHDASVTLLSTDDPAVKEADESPGGEDGRRDGVKTRARTRTRAASAESKAAGTPGVKERRRARRSDAGDEGAPAAERRMLRESQESRAGSHRIAEQPAFVLHSYPYRETSLIIDVFSRDHGRLALVAKGAKRPHSALRGVLQTFQPLSMSWSGKSEMRTLTGAEWVGGMLPLMGDALLCGFYVNELLVKFCAREDPHPQLFHHYVVTLTRLAHDEPPVQVLRSFERVLLRETGYAMALDRTVARKAVTAEGRYVFDPERGVREAANGLPAHWPVVSGQTLLDMECDDYHRAQTVAQSKTLMRFLLNTYLGGTPLATRQILLDLQNL